MAKTTCKKFTYAKYSSGGDGAAILPEFKFDAKTPPMFMLHGDKDYYSPMASVQIYTELHKRKIPAQLFVYANVSHGLGDTATVKGWQLTYSMCPTVASRMWAMSVRS